MLGEQMANIIATETVNLGKDLNPLLVQVVLQIAITTWCRFVISSWKPIGAHFRLSSDGWTENLMNGLLSVLVIAGWPTREPDQQHQFERRLPPLFKAVQDLGKTLGEDAASMDMEVAIIDPGEAFNPTYMENGYGDARASSGSGKKTLEKVSGTTGFGLHKISMKHTSKGPLEVVLLPKVVLEGTVKEVMDSAPPPVSGLRKKPKKHRDRHGTGGGG